jgi:hypothetical protein
MKPAFSDAFGWNLAVCCSASFTSSMADSSTPMPMERVDTLGVAGSKTGKVLAFRLAFPSSCFSDICAAGRRVADVGWEECTVALQVL